MFVQEKVCVIALKIALACQGTMDSSVRHSIVDQIYLIVAQSVLEMVPVLLLISATVFLVILVIIVKIISVMVYTTVCLVYAHHVANV